MNNATRCWALTSIAVLIVLQMKIGESPVYSAAQPNEKGVELAQVINQVRRLRLGMQSELAAPGLFVAQEGGALAGAGLALEIRRLGWGEIMDSLAAGGLDVGLIDPVAHLSARALGHDLRIVAAGSGEQASASTRSLVVPGRSTIQRVTDLADHWIGVTALGSPDHLMLQAWFGRQGIDPASVRFVELPAPLLVSALQNSRLDAALLSEPYLSAAVELGARVLDSPYGDLTKEPTPLSYFVTDGAWLSSHGEVAHRFATAIHRIHADLQASPSAYRAALVAHGGVDQALADRLALPTLQTRVTLSQVQTWADILSLPQTATTPGLAPLPLVTSDLLYDTVR